MNEIRLRALEPEDLELLYKVENDRSMWEVGTTNVPYSKEALRQFILNSSCDIYADRQVRMIAETTDGTIVGIADLINFEPQHRRAEVGIVVMPEYRGKGYGTKMLQQLKDYAQKVVHLHQLYAYVAEDNEASKRLFTNAKFTSHSILKDWLFDGEKYMDCVVMQLFL